MLRGTATCRDQQCRHTASGVKQQKDRRAGLAADCNNTDFSHRPLGCEPNSEVTDGDPAQSTPSAPEHRATTSYHEPPDDGHTGGDTKCPAQRSRVRGPPDICASPRLPQIPPSNSRY
jgi:hypothetical protein